MHRLVYALAILGSFGMASGASPIRLQTRDCRIQLDGKGFIDSIVARRSGSEYSPTGHSSPLLSLNIRDQLVSPTSAVYDAKTGIIQLGYPQGSVAIVRAVAKDRYFRFQLVSLTNRDAVDDVVWGPVHTAISKLIGDLIGVVRNDDWAIGMVGLDDNTIAGPAIPGECYGMRYYVHSPDPKNVPLPPQYKEGQWFNIGGDGVNDVAFYSHPEEYFQMTCGTAAVLEPEFGSSLTYHSRDRRKSYTFVYSLLPGFKGSRPRHQVTDPVNADYIGSAIALYSCPDKAGLSTIENIELAEGLPHPMIDGKWIHDLSGLKPSISWYGRHDKLIEYADALGLKSVHDEGQGEYYANPADHWLGNRVGFSGGKELTYRQFTDQTNAHGIKYGLHTLCLFLQPGRCTDVTPNASAHLQPVLRTKLADDVSPTDAAVTITDPSYLMEDGTWPMRDGSNTVRIGTELIHYDGISETAPYTLKGVKRGFDGTQAQAHHANDEVAKLQMNCYDGFCPDLELMLKYADYYAAAMSENGMRYVDFDGLESTLYQNQGYFGVRRFFRRFFDTYAKLTGGLAPRVMGSCVFAGGWEYMSVCDVGGGNNSFDPILNHWGIEGKDIRNGFGNSYFPVTLGGQNLHSDWSVYDAENLQSKAIGWDGTFVLGLSEDAVERCGEKQEIFKAIRTWEDARESGIFTRKIKARLRDLDYKFHLERTGRRSYSLVPIKEVRVADKAGAVGKAITLNNTFDAQPLQFSIQFASPVDGCDILLPDGLTIECKEHVEAGQFVIGKGSDVYHADKNRKKLNELSISHPARLPRGKSTIEVRPLTNADVGFELTVWLAGKSVKIHG
ncbi:MAG: hypothetical protein P4L46_01545 [Fimbriimonas sp.]|nr:hypothetical protein [Fimbriimonas sp.]